MGCSRLFRKYKYDVIYMMINELALEISAFTSLLLRSSFLNPLSLPRLSPICLMVLFLLMTLFSNDAMFLMCSRILLLLSSFLLAKQPATRFGVPLYLLSMVIVPFLLITGITSIYICLHIACFNIELFVIVCCKNDLNIHSCQS